MKSCNYQNIPQIHDGFLNMKKHTADNLNAHRQECGYVFTLTQRVLSECTRRTLQRILVSLHTWNSAVSFWFQDHIFFWHYFDIRGIWKHWSVFWRTMKFKECYKWSNTELFRWLLPKGLFSKRHLRWLYRALMENKSMKIWASE